MERLLVGNWKMNPASINEAKKIYLGIKKKALKSDNVSIVLCPPSIFLSQLNPSKNIFLGAQNINEEYVGAFTGEISAPMVSSLKANFVIIGHSERRKMGETDLLVNKKINTAMASGLRPIVCIGEVERDTDGNYLSEIKNQIKIATTKIAKKDLKNIIFAYEPVWAIGKDESIAPTGSDMNEMSIFIKKVLTDLFDKESAGKVSILYGGSVTDKNAYNIFTEGGINGFLVGRQSLYPDVFGEILKIVSEN